eukprot:scaffold2902_cov333-Pinguiococcus_pyrenoidosus.AAC.3
MIYYAEGDLAWDVSGRFTLASIGDTLLLYQLCDTSSPSFIHGVSWYVDGWVDASIRPPSLRSSNLPAELEAAGAFVELPDLDNHMYAGPKTGSVAAVKSAINDPANWLSENQKLAYMYGADFVWSITARRLQSQAKTRTLLRGASMTE